MLLELLSVTHTSPFHDPVPNVIADSKAATAIDYAGHYSHTSLRPVASFIDRPALHTLIKEQLHNTLVERSHTAKNLVVYGLGGPANHSWFLIMYGPTEKITRQSFG